MATTTPLFSNFSTLQKQGQARPPAPVQGAAPGGIQVGTQVSPLLGATKKPTEEEPPAKPTAPAGTVPPTLNPVLQTMTGGQAPAVLPPSFAPSGTGPSTPVITDMRYRGPQPTPPVATETPAQQPGITRFGGPPIVETVDQMTNRNPVAPPTPPGVTVNASDPEGTLKKQWEGTTGNQMTPQMKDAITKALANPSRYDAEMARKTFDSLNQELTNSQNADLQSIREDAARRGIGDSTFYTTSRANLADRYGQQRQQLAQNIAREQATTYGQDWKDAISAAMSLGGLQNAEQQTAYGNLSDFEKQKFQQQLQQQMLNNQMSQQDFEQMLQVLQAMG